MEVYMSGFLIWNIYIYIFYVKKLFVCVFIVFSFVFLEKEVVVNCELVYVVSNICIIMWIRGVVLIFL